MPRPAMPTLDQVRALPRIHSLTAPQEWQDLNGHVNVQHYLGMYDAAGWPFFQSLGQDETYLTERMMGFFDLEHHLHYVSEILVGEDVSIHSRLLSRSDKRLHGMWFIVNDTRDRLSNTFEFVSASVDLRRREMAPWPDDIAAAYDAKIAETADCDWPAPVCGVMGP